MILPGMLLLQPFSHSEQHFAVSAEHFFSQWSPWVHPAPLGIGPVLRLLHAGTKTACNSDACLLCVSPDKIPTAQINPVVCTNWHLIKLTISVCYRGWDRGTYSIQRCDSPWGVDQWPCLLQGDKLRKGVRHKVCNVKQPMEGEDIYPTPPVAELRWDMPDIWCGEKHVLWVLESNFA